jgi:hypothetical protein
VLCLYPKGCDPDKSLAASKQIRSRSCQLWESKRARSGAVQLSEM